MTVGKATNADNATNANVADKAVKDNNGAKISDTYATKTGNFPNMTVGNATNANNSSNSTKATQSNFVANNPSGNIPSGCLKLAVVTSLPTSADNNTLYFVEEA